MRRSDPEPGRHPRQKGVEIKARPAGADEFLPSLIFSWFPMLLMVGVWIFFMRQMQAGARQGHGLRQVQGQAADREAMAG